MRWEDRSIGEVSEIYSGYAFKSVDMISNPEPNSYPVIKIKNVNGRSVSKECDSHLPEGLYRTNYLKYILKEGDILVAMTGQGSVGRIGKMREIDQTYLVNQRVGIIRVNPGIASPEFVYQQISNENAEKYYYDLAFGAGQPNLSPTDIGSLKIKYPPLPIQRKIASILSAYDDLIENNLKRIKLLEEKARIEFMSIQNKEVLEYKKAVEVLEFTTGKLNSNAAVSNGLYPFFTCGQEMLRTNTFCLDEEVVLLGGNNASAIYPVFYYNGKFDAYQRTYIIRPKPEINISFKYLYFFWEGKLDYLKNISTGAATKFLTLKILNDIDVPLPSKKTMEEYEILTQPIFRLRAVLTEQNTKLREARDILLPRLMSGEVEV